MVVHRQQSLAVWLLLCGIAATAVAEVPERIDSDDPERTTPIWVSLDLALPGGDLDENLFAGWELEEIRRFFAGLESEPRSRRPPRRDDDFRDCRTTIVTSRCPPYPTFEELVDKTTGIVLGRFRDRSKGFYRGFLTTLWEIEIDQRLQWPGDASAEAQLPTSIFVSYGATKLRYKGRVVCTSNHALPLKPHEGGRVLILGSVPKAGADANPLSLTDQNIIFEDRSGTVHLPLGIEAPDRPRWEFVEEKLRAVGLLPLPQS